MASATRATRSIEISAPPSVIYDLISDVTRMGQWSPECVRCEWQGAPGQVGSTFKGYNRNGLARWSTVARVEVADRPREFRFATLYRDAPSTSWTYQLDGDGPTTVSESFEAIHIPKWIELFERIFARNRQAQLEAGIDQTLAAVKRAAEAQAPAP